MSDTTVAVDETITEPTATEGEAKAGNETESFEVDDTGADGDLQRSASIQITIRHHNNDSEAAAKPEGLQTAQFQYEHPAAEQEERKFGYRLKQDLNNNQPGENQGWKLQKCESDDDCPSEDHFCHFAICVGGEFLREKVFRMCFRVCN